MMCYSLETDDTCWGSVSDQVTNLEVEHTHDERWHSFSGAPHVLTLQHQDPCPQLEKYDCHQSLHVNNIIALLPEPSAQPLLSSSSLQSLTSLTFQMHSSHLESSHCCSNEQGCWKTIQGFRWRRHKLTRRWICDTVVVHVITKFIVLSWWIKSMKKIYSTRGSS